MAGRSTWQIALSVISALLFFGVAIESRCPFGSDESCSFATNLLDAGWWAYGPGYDPDVAEWCVVLQLL